MPTTEAQFKAAMVPLITDNAKERNLALNSIRLGEDNTYSITISNTAKVEEGLGYYANYFYDLRKGKALNGIGEELNKSIQDLPAISLLPSGNAVVINIPASSLSNHKMQEFQKLTSILITRATSLSKNFLKIPDKDLGPTNVEIKHRKEDNNRIPALSGLGRVISERDEYYINISNSEFREKLRPYGTADSEMSSPLKIAGENPKQSFLNEGLEKLKTKLGANLEDIKFTPNGIIVSREFIGKRDPKNFAAALAEGIKELPPVDSNTTDPERVGTTNSIEGMVASYLGPSNAAWFKESDTNKRGSFIFPISGDGNEIVDKLVEMRDEAKLGKEEIGFASNGNVQIQIGGWRKAEGFLKEHAPAIKELLGRTPNQSLEKRGDLDSAIKSARLHNTGDVMSDRGDDTPNTASLLPKRGKTEKPNPLLG